MQFPITWLSQSNRMPTSPWRMSGVSLLFVVDSLLNSFLLPWHNWHLFHWLTKPDDWRLWNKLTWGDQMNNSRCVHCLRLVCDSTVQVSNQPALHSLANAPPTMINRPLHTAAWANYINYVCIKTTTCLCHLCQLVGWVLFCFQDCQSLSFEKPYVTVTVICLLRYVSLAHHTLRVFSNNINGHYFILGHSKNYFIHQGSTCSALTDRIPNWLNSTQLNSTQLNSTQLNSTIGY